MILQVGHFVLHILFNPIWSQAGNLVVFLKRELIFGGHIILGHF